MTNSTPAQADDVRTDWLSLNPIAEFVNEAKRKSAAASAGPWVVRGVSTSRRIHGGDMPIASDMLDRNANFIADARTTVPQLAALVQAVLYACEGASLAGEDTVTIQELAEQLHRVLP